MVDKEHKFTPRRVLKTRKGIKSTYTDHFSLKIELKGIPKKQQQEKQQITWNLNKPGGWSDYKTTTNKEAHKITEAVHEETDIEKVMKKINAIDTKIKFKTFGKTKIVLKNLSTVKQCIKPCSKSDCDECKNQDEKDKALLKRRTEQIESAVIKNKRQQARKSRQYI